MINILANDGISNSGVEELKNQVLILLLPMLLKSN
jgi:hypothetical protein